MSGKISTATLINTLQITYLTAVKRILRILEEDIEDIKRWISEEGEDAQVALYYAQHEGAYVFNDFDIYVEGMDFTYDNYLITTLKKALAVLELQDEMFDNVTN